MKYYIDESGNTGDLVVSENNLNFNSQEYFTLACIGIEDSILNELNEYINTLKKKYKIQNKELKFSRINHIFGRKIEFILDLITYLEENNSQFLIEIVDKKYIIATNIVNCLINPPYFQPERDPYEEKEIHLALSQWVYDYIPHDFFIKFSNTSRNPSEEKLNELFNDIVKITEVKNDDLSKSILENIKESIDDYEKIKSEKNKNQKLREAYTYFLPLPDYNKRNEIIGILPYVASFANLHARLNYIYGDELSSITIIHDNQDHFDKIIQQYHESAIEDSYPEKRNIHPTNFNFSTLSNLEFHNDKDEIGLQVSDIFAGFTNKATAYLIKGENSLSKEENAILLKVLVKLYKWQSINFVLPTEHNKEILFPVFDQVLIIDDIISKLLGK